MRYRLCAIAFASLFVVGAASAAGTANTAFSGPDPRKTYAVPGRLVPPKPEAIAKLESKLGRLEKKADELSARGASKEKIARVEAKALKLTVRADLKVAQRALRRIPWAEMNQDNPRYAGAVSRHLGQAGAYLRDAQRQRKELINKHTTDVGLFTRAKMVRLEGTATRRWPQWDKARDY